MIRFKPAQIDAFAEASAATFPERLLGFLERQLGEEDAGQPGDEGDADAGDASPSRVVPPLTEAAVRGAISRAHHHGLHGELDVATFAVLVFTHGPGFAEEPWARALLEAPEVPASTRIHNVYEAAIRRDLVKGTALAR